MSRRAAGLSLSAKRRMAAPARACSLSTFSGWTARPPTTAPGGAPGALADDPTARRPSLRFSEHLEGDGPEIYRHACALGLEGIVSKRRDARYRSGRSLTWLKIKNPVYERP